MSATAIRSGELLAFPAALRRGLPVASASVVAFRLRAPVAGRVAVRVVAAAAEGAGAEAEAEGKPKPKKKRAASGIMKPKPISPELREFVGGAAELPRTEALKIIWAHIKGNNLQVFSI
uniref:DM2 domain-containing protein n=1 Tax=Aegilops tauschii subsp. strangulata TaxID=200361 RepID=A0A453K386_AEGTS